MVGVGKQPRSGRQVASKGGYIHSSLVSLFLYFIWHQLGFCRWTD